MDVTQLLKQYSDKTVKLGDGVRVHKITNNLVDIFQGDGWNVCSRYRVVKNKLVHLSGPTLGTKVYQQVSSALTKS